MSLLHVIMMQLLQLLLLLLLVLLLLLLRTSAGALERLRACTLAGSARCSVACMIALPLRKTVKKIGHLTYLCALLLAVGVCACAGTRPITQTLSCRDYVPPALSLQSLMTTKWPTTHGTYCPVTNTAYSYTDRQYAMLRPF